MADTKIGKIWLHPEMKKAIERWCWDNQMRPSPLAKEAIRDIAEDPALYAGKPIPPAGTEYISVYVERETWARAIEAIEPFGVPLGAMVRVALAELLKEEGIPWDESSKRPKNQSIPNPE